MPIALLVLVMQPTASKHYKELFTVQSTSKQSTSFIITLSKSNNFTKLVKKVLTMVYFQTHLLEVWHFLCQFLQQILRLLRCIPGSQTSNRCNVSQLNLVH